MHEAGFTKLFSTIVTSTIWQENKETKILWITMLALANRYGEVGAAEPGLAHSAGLTLDETLKSLKKLESPDPYSRNQGHEGRRIAKIEGGWQILNYTFYRKKMRNRAEYFREYRKRNKNATRITTAIPIAEAEAEAEADNNIPPISPLSIQPTIEQVKDECFKQGMTDQDGERIHAHYNKKGWVDGAGQPLTDLTSTVTAWRLNPRRQTEQQVKPETIHEQAERLREAGELDV